MTLQVARDGREALQYIFGEGEFADRDRFPVPCLVLLDLNIPYVPGTEVLKRIRSNPKLKKLIVVMLSSSVDEFQIAEAYEAGVNSYVEKPLEFFELLHTVMCINAYWFGCNHFPHAQAGIVRPRKQELSRRAI